MSILTHDQLLTLHGAARRAGLGASRHALLLGIEDDVVANLQITSQQGDQLLSDLVALNNLERLPDGTAPLLVWLANAATLAGSSAEALVFRAALDRHGGLGRVHSGPPTKPPEGSLLRLGVAVVLLVFFVTAAGITFNIPYWVSSVLSAVVVAFGTAVGLLRYLRGDFRPASGESPTKTIKADSLVSDREFRELRRTVRGLEARLAALSATKDSTTTQNEVSTLVAKLREEALQAITEELESRLESRLQRVAHIAAARRVFLAATRRINDELGSVGLRSNLNLVIGVVTTVGAVVLLAYMVLKAPPVFDSVTALLSHYIPRLTTIVFIELFSFFFLRLYRSGLGDMQYYQNQLTELARSEVALEAAMSTGELEVQKGVIVELSKVAPLGRGNPSETTLKEVGEFIERIGRVAVDAYRPDKAKDK